MNDLATFPESITVAFPATGSGASATGFFSVVVNLVDLGLVEFNNITGAPWTKLLHRYETATYSGGGSPTNATALTDLAQQVAIDWYLWQLGALDQYFTGSVDWTPEGSHDVEWAQQDSKVTTHVQRDVFNPNEDLILPVQIGFASSDGWVGATVTQSGLVSTDDQIFPGNKGTDSAFYAHGNLIVGTLGTVNGGIRSPRRDATQDDPFGGVENPGGSIGFVIASYNTGVYTGFEGETQIVAYGDIVIGSTQYTNFFFFQDILCGEVIAGIPTVVIRYGTSFTGPATTTWSPTFLYMSGFDGFGLPTYATGTTGTVSGLNFIGGHLVGGSISGVVTSITGDSGGALAGAITITGGSTGLTFTGSGSTLTLSGTLAAANGGFGKDMSAETGLPVFDAGVEQTATNAKISPTDNTKLQLQAGSGRWIQLGSTDL